MKSTSHFQTRTQQRGINRTMVEVILGLGRMNDKGDLMLVGRKEIDQALSIISDLRRDLDRMRSHGGAAIAFDGDTMITAFHRYKKFHRS